MFGFRFIKVPPTEYLLQYRNGQPVREGVGLSFFYFAPTTSLVRVPVGTTDVPFIFEEVTADFQAVTVQGQLTYRVADPKKLAGLMNFTLAANGQDYVSDDPLKLAQRLISHAQVLTASALKGLPLRSALSEVDRLVTTLRGSLLQAGPIAALGIEIVDFSVLAVKPLPETSRALEAEVREQILRQADEAIYARRNAAVEQERAIKENELNTEIAVENKRRQIRETQMDAEMAVQRKQHELRAADMSANITLEEKNRELVALAADNAKLQAEAQAHGIAAVMKAFGQADPRVLQALAATGMEPGQLLALAFRDLAAGADKIGQLNVSPDLLRELLQKAPERSGKK